MTITAAATRTVQADSVSGVATLQKSSLGAAHVLTQGTPAYPLGATPITGSSGNVANAVATATLAAVAGKTTYITGFEVTGAGATAGLPVSATVTGVVTGTLTYTAVAAAGALVANTPLLVAFPVAIPASAVNAAIAVTVPAFGLGNTHSTVVAHGYQL